MEAGKKGQGKFSHVSKWSLLAFIGSSAILGALLNNLWKLLSGAVVSYQSTLHQWKHLSVQSKDLWFTYLDRRVSEGPTSSRGDPEGVLSLAGLHTLMCASLKISFAIRNVDKQWPIRLHGNTLHILFSTKTKFCCQLLSCFHLGWS